MTSPLLRAEWGTANVRRLPQASSARIWREAQADAQALSFRRDPRRLLAGGLGVFDATLIALASAIAHLLRHGLLPVEWEVASSTGLAMLLTVNALYVMGAYSNHLIDRLPQQIARVARVWTGAFVCLLLLAYLTKTSDSYSRVWAIVWYATALALLSGARLVTAAQVGRWRARGRFASTVAVVDLCGDGDAVGTQIRRGFPSDAHLVGVFRPALDPQAADGIADLLALSRLFRIDEVLVLVAAKTRTDVPAVLRRLANMTSNVRVCPVLPDLASTPLRDAQLVLGLPALTVHRKPLGGWSSVIKRAEDLLLSSVALLVLAPLMLIVGICIRLETPGPALFRQARQGFNNNVFTVFKFRTMVNRPPEKDVPQATRNDPRVTRLGRFLRRTSLDELPQLLNVLRGEMSLVGPRPHAIAHNERYATLIDDYIARHRVQPGITGWAQVNGLRGETDTLDKMQRRVEFDLAYIDRWSIMFDLRIILLTALTAVFHREAY